MAKQELNKPSAKPIPPQDEAEQITPISLETEDGKEALEPIRLVDVGEERATAVKAFGSGAARKARRDIQFNRPLNVTGQGATRCRIFSSRIAVNPLEYMESQINEWLDADQIEIKHVGHVVGVMEGKVSEPNLIVMVWY